MMSPTSYLRWERGSAKSPRATALARALLPDKVWEAVVTSLQPTDSFASPLLWGRGSRRERRGDGVTGAAGRPSPAPPACLD